MKVTLTSENGDVFRLEIGVDLTVQDLQALAELETAIPQDQMLLIHNMAPLADPRRPLTQYGVEEGDVIMVSRLEGGGVDPTTRPAQPHPQTSHSLPTSIDWSSISIPTTSDPGTTQPRNRGQQPQGNPDDPETIRQHFLNHPYELARLRQQNPPLAEALLSGDRERFHDALARQRRAMRDAERERIRILNADPLDPTYQAKIAQDIRQRNIEENMEAAIEFTPESFSHVVMLYLEIKVNGVPVTALVDSGARSTVMSQACAERCNIMRLVDRRSDSCRCGTLHLCTCALSQNCPHLRNTLGTP
jgi:DNA damage-inducible protein 1